MTINYTIPADFAVAELRGVTLTDGELSHYPSAGKMVEFATYRQGNVVRFADPRDTSKTILVKLADKPDLIAAVRAHLQAEADAATAKRAAEEAALEAAVPGITELVVAQEAAEMESARYQDEFAAMMDDELNDGVRPPRPKDRSHAQRRDAIVATNPRAALYLKAKRQAEHAHWADNTGAGAAARKAMGILAAGGSTGDAEAALAERREWVD